MSQSGRIGAHGRELEKRFYVTVRQKFVIATIFSILWFAASLWLAQPWVRELSQVVGAPLAWTIVFMMAMEGHIVGKAAYVGRFHGQ